MEIGTLHIISDMISLSSFYVFLSSLLCIVVAKAVDKNPPPIFGVYQRRNGLYWLKVTFMFLILSLKKIKNSLFPESQEFISNLDKVQTLPHNIKAVDAVYFNGSNRHLDYFILGTARRKNRLVDGILFLKIHASNLGVLQFPKTPDISLFNSGNEDSYEAEGIKITPLEPMRKWGIAFDGQLKEFGSNGKSHDVKIAGIWCSNEPWFNYDTDMDPWDMAKAIAYEKWSRNYFQTLQANHQTHYEQFGILKAKITIDQEEYTVEMDTLRDHSIGEQREWAQFRRYGLHFLTTENGDHFSLGSICFPISFSRLKIGYVYNASERKIYPVRNSSLELYQHGELGNPPKDYAFSFSAGKTDYVIQVSVTDFPYFYISKNWEAKIFDGLCTFRVNGIKGWGAAEWQYRNIQGRKVLRTLKERDFEAVRTF